MREFTYSGRSEDLLTLKNLTGQWDAVEDIQDAHPYNRLGWFYNPEFQEIGYLVYYEEVVIGFLY